MADKRGERSPRRSAGPKKSSGMRQECQRLIAAVLLFGLCFAGKTLFPQQAERGAALVRNMLTSSSHFETAFADLGEDLSEGKGVAESVGSWCVTVFSPQEVTVSEEKAGGSETETSEKSTWWEWLFGELKSRLFPS